eukprot:COSAG05_NODE_3489_length_2030_cov_1.288969_2_plen_394_part_00
MHGTDEVCSASGLRAVHALFRFTRMGAACCRARRRRPVEALLRWNAAQQLPSLLLGDTMASTTNIPVLCAASGVAGAALGFAFATGCYWRSAVTPPSGDGSSSSARGAQAAAPQTTTPEPAPAKWSQGSFRQLSNPTGGGVFSAREPWQRAQELFSPAEQERLRQRNHLATAQAQAAAAATATHPYADMIRGLPAWTAETVPRWPPAGVSPENVALTLVDTPAAVGSMVDKLAKLKVFALDVESYGERCFYGLVCTLQISTAEHGNFLVDALAVREALRERFNEVSANPAVLKIMHGCEDDVKCLQRDFGAHLVNVFDTQVAAIVLKRRCCNQPNFNDLLQETLGLQLDKTQRAEDWSQRPLPLEMAYYAVSDSHFLLPVAAILRSDKQDAAA